MRMRLTDGELGAYLERIGVARPEQADLAALQSIHRAHAYAFTWETIDCFMGRPSSIDPAEAFAKMVGRRRGGWCYEMNGLLGAALSACGFAVTRLCGGVRRADMGENAVGNHLTLRVDLDQPWLAEAGLGDALVDPVPLAVGPSTQRGFAFAIERADGDWLRFRNHPHGAAPSFDFRADYVDEGTLQQAQRWLLESPDSPFTGALVIQRHFPDRIESVINTTWRTTTPQGMTERAIGTAEDFTALLTGTFELDEPEMDALWDRVRRRADQRSL